MTLTPDLLDEIDLLLKFDLSSAQVGLKIHSDAAPEIIAAASRLHAKGLVDREDGGFLTPLGHEAAEHLQFLQQILTADPAAI
ncbi:TIGR02647 family protein [Haliea sp. E1-2-M8]|uniref:TIGR02647 family protein n=1 Tax=Haliea sp. E1-2-M8 TaxID=3064706 RepID=UPI00272499A4|nr:TIGR02647 family protein [Haliea sp. E1-2-M8]MDO8861062.1 TIGR02647 family protein [Haliea sp. E1-2-M8]